MHTTILAIAGIIANISASVPLFSGISLPISPAEAKTQMAYDVYVTAYSSTPDQTDDTPFITATGNRVRDGIIAANFLDFGTQVQIPELFGEQIFIVDDRMHPRKKDFIDIWMPTKEEAFRFGITYATILVVND